jgi:hypothetical protein
VGEPVGVHKGIELIASHLRKFLVDRSIIPVFEMHVSLFSSIYIYLYIFFSFFFFSFEPAFDFDIGGSMG